jgi:hypothetical protein
MTLAQAWLRQAIGAAGASLLVPAAIFIAAAALAAGGGLGGLSSLGQIASGPTLPTPTETPAGSELAEADIVGADLAAVSGATGASTAAGGTATPPGSAIAAPVRGLLAPLRTPTPNVGGGSPSEPAPTGELVTPPVGGGMAPAEPPTQGPVAELIDTTQGVGEELVGPLAPITDPILDLVLPPPR